MINQEQIIPEHFRLQLAAPEITALAQPGQFLHISCGHTLDPLLRRPLSLHDVDRNKGEITLFYRVAGKGTAHLAQLSAGAGINLLGPLGRGFTIPGDKVQPILAAGGMGIAPLFFLLRELTRRHITAHVFLGAATAQMLFFQEEIQAMGHRISVATDDGSLGYHGVVTTLLADFLATLSPTDLSHSAIYSCGPSGMLRHISSIVKEKGIPGEISLEEHMGCGVGACLSCVFKIKEARDNWRYQRICTEGPVFPAEKVVWE